MSARYMDNNTLSLLRESIECAKLVTIAKILSSIHIDAGNDVSIGMREKISEINDIFGPLVNIAGRVGEDRSCALFDYAMASGGMHFSGDLHPGVIRSTREFQLPIGRVDRLLEHDDGSFTTVEIKPSGSRRDIAQGLGQAVMYAAAMRITLNDERDVRPALFVSSNHDPYIAAACDMAGVTYLHFSLDEQRLVSGLARIHSHHMVPVYG